MITYWNLCRILWANSINTQTTNSYSCPLQFPVWIGVETNSIRRPRIQTSKHSINVMIWFAIGLRLNANWVRVLGFGMARRLIRPAAACQGCSLVKAGFLGVVSPLHVIPLSLNYSLVSFQCSSRRRPSGLRKARLTDNSLAHKTIWLYTTFSSPR